MRWHFGSLNGLHLWSCGVKHLKDVCLASHIRSQTFLSMSSSPPDRSRVKTPHCVSVSLRAAMSSCYVAFHDHESFFSVLDEVNQSACISQVSYVHRGKKRTSLVNAISPVAL
jgi:hypothetical protein